MEDGQRVDQHVTALRGCAPAPIGFEHLRVVCQVAVGQHGTLAAACGATGVENGGQVVSLPLSRCVDIRTVGSALQQSAGAVVAQGENALCARLEGDFADPAKVGRGAHHHGRLGIANEILNLGTLVSRVKRQKDQPRPQCGQV